MRRMNRVTLGVVVMLTAAVSAEEATSPPIVGLALTGDEAVEFLKTAEVSSKPEDFDDLAITSPRRLELTKDGLTLRVIFKDENTLHRGTFKYGDGREVPMVKDSYLHEVAAYEVDRLLGLDLVAPCVERKLFKRKGSLCLWVEDSMTEAERKERNLQPTDYRSWNEQMFRTRLFQQLISDQDFSNIRNIVVDSNFRIYKIDSSMAFYSESRLIDRLDPPLYSRAFLDALEGLDRDEVNARLKPWLLKAQINALWDRREKILERAAKLVSERGEGKTLY